MATRKKKHDIYRDGMTETMYVTHDGKAISVHDMHDKHLQNALRLIVRARDMAAREFKRTQKEMDTVVQSTIPCYATMLCELKARGLSL